MHMYGVTNGSLETQQHKKAPEIQKGNTSDSGLLTGLSHLRPLAPGHMSCEGLS